MMKTKKIPMRMCLGCGEMKPKRELIRVVKSKEGDWSEIQQVNVFPVLP